MLRFVLTVIVASIVIDLVAGWLKLVPRYTLRYAFLMHAINTVLLTAVLTLFVTAGVYPSWALLAALMLLILWLSVRSTNAIARRRGEPAEKPAREPRA